MFPNLGFVLIVLGALAVVWGGMPHKPRWRAVTIGGVLLAVACGAVLALIFIRLHGGS